jgi:hypothetical protein
MKPIIKIAIIDFSLGPIILTNTHIINEYYPCKVRVYVSLKAKDEIPADT